MFDGRKKGAAHFRRLAFQVCWKIQLAFRHQRNDRHCFRLSYTCAVINLLQHETTYRDPNWLHISSWFIPFILLSYIYVWQQGIDLKWDVSLTIVWLISWFYACLKPVKSWIKASCRQRSLSQEQREHSPTSHPISLKMWCSCVSHTPSRWHTPAALLSSASPWGGD